MIERYLFQLEKYLPKKSKEDIIAELRSLIHDEVEAHKEDANQPEDAIIHDVLTALGSPQKVASSYLHKNHFIAKELEPLFWSIAKILFIVIPVILFFAITIRFFSIQPSYNYGSYLLYILLHSLEILFATAAWFGILCIIFYRISSSIDGDSESNAQSFNPSRLPRVPKLVYQISPIERLTAIALSIAALYMLNLIPGVFAIRSGNFRMPLLNEQFSSLLVFINIGLVTAIGLATIDLILQKKTFATKTMAYIHALFITTILFLLPFSDIFNEVLIEGYNLDIVVTMIKVALIISGIAVFSGATFDYLKVFLRPHNKA